MAVDLVVRDVIELQALGRDEAKTLLQKSLIDPDMVGNKEPAVAELLDELADLPLAIVQAAAYLNTNTTTMPRYLRLLRNTEQDMVSLMSAEFRDSARYEGATNAVASTWLVSFEQIRKYDEIAAGLLAYVSCIEPKAIPRSILPTVQPEARMETAIGTLCGYAFLTRRAEDETFDVHRLVHLGMRIWGRHHGDASTETRKAMQHLAGIFPSDHFEKRKLWREYLPHAVRLLQEQEEEEEEEPKKYELCISVGRCLQADGRVREAVDFLEQAWRWRCSNMDEKHSDRLLSQYTLAIAYQADGQVGMAVELLEHVVAVEAKVLAEDHPSRLASQHELAITYQADGQVSKAVELLEHVVTIEAKVLTEDHPDRLASQHELAIAYKADGQVNKTTDGLSRDGGVA
ncbi:hypothetical protein EPUS_09097 [Endocarpon pusillum Z07020]|uniref:MalT-like TPR region domain-containing protein n=1 Tax=Endocarpon pusillum (strain Z07020 / HMAS-L-300199) TaxID=1263415 RepID=U1GSB9_ENDPU|nr:uncharacterized protein EPUS_09097 [Endocarpon pusillum Z07020]ERF74891.1 hypothetical protein EPUS_09097 [Endocarpon pusillum Z07020]